MEIALLIDGPVSSATLRYLRTPMIVGARDRDCKCGSSRHDHSAKYPNKERAPHISISFPITLQSKVAISKRLSEKKSGRALSFCCRGVRGGERLFISFGG